MEIASADLAPLRELYGRGMYLEAWRAAERFGPMQAWTNPAARLLGGRLAIQLGGARLGRWLHLRAYRETPSHPEAIYYHARYRLERFGPYATWRFLRSHPDQDWNDAAPEVRADWYGLHAFVCGRLRDFDRAERWLNKATSITHDRAWLCVERASVYEFAERFDDALAAARRASELVPNFRPGVQAEAHLLQYLGREKEALERLTQAVAKIESGIIVAHLAAIQMDLRHYADARKTYERYAELSPLLDEETGKWLAARRADTAYYVGDMSAARDHAVQAEEPFYDRFAEELQQAPATAAPLRLEMPRVNPLHRPFAPAHELLARYWSVRTANAPDTYAQDGLPDCRERQWAEQNNLVAVEFTITAESLHQLIERGVPFCILMIDGGYGYSQIVCGSDRVRASFWLRDASDNRANEAPCSVLTERYASTGPRGLILLPKIEQNRLEGIVLADRPLHDGLHQVQAALAKHERAVAVNAYEQLKTAEPTHRLTRLARFAIARYDANPTLMLHAIDALLALHPDDNTYVLTKFNILRELGRRDERNELVRKQLSRKNADVMFAHHHAQNLMPNPERLFDAERVMRPALRHRPNAPAGYYILGNILWEQRRFQEATDLYRFAAALEDRDEQFAEAYFRAARALEQTPDALRFLQLRYDRTKGKLAGPARAMFYAMSEQDEMATAFEALEQFAHGSDVVPTEHGEVLLFAAEMRTNYNEPDEGKQLIERAKGLATKGSWLRSVARQALVRADLVTARQAWEDVYRDEPLAGDVHRNLSRAISDLEGRAAAVAWVRQEADKFPHHYPLQQLLIDWLRGEHVPEGTIPPAEAVIRHLIEVCPDDAWARRELALHLTNNNRAAEALQEMEAARDLEPNSPSYFYTYAHALARNDQTSEAAEMYRQAIHRSAENEVAISELLNLARGDAEKKEAIEFIGEELKRQTMIGDGLLTFREHASQAHDAIEPDDLLRLLQEIFDDHAELWHCWSVVIQQMLLTGGRLEEAKQLAKEAVERYPLLARLWVDLAEVCRAQEDPEGQLEALDQAVQVAPGWSYAAREYADALEANDQAEAARVVLEQAVARSPLDPVNHGFLADNLWNDHQSEEAVLRLEIALKIDPGYEWAWRHLGVWTERMDLPDRAIDVAREVCRLRPGDPRAWMALARLLTHPSHNDEVLASLDRAIVLSPRALEAYDLKAERLAEMGRFDEAKASATPAIFADEPPMILQGRAAWVEARRGNFPLACREMRALVNIEPAYYWGWQQLAEWYNESRRPEEFLEAAEKLVELRPENPIALAMRGEARLQNDDREGGKEDLRAAQHIEPGYSYPGMLLFDAHLQDDEYPQARAALAVLEEHIAGSGRPYVLARYTQLAARRKDEDGAVEAFREVVTLPCDSTWPIHSSASEMRTAGWGHRVDEILRSTLEQSEDFHPWTLMVWLESKVGTEADLDTKVELVRRVTRIHPRYAQAYDVLAELLVRQGEYEEALQLCQAPEWGDRVPLLLRGRGAWILAQQGDRKAAITQMRTIVDIDPEYHWGWQQLATWYDEERMTVDYLEATEQLVRISPNDPSAFGFRGEARGANGDRRGAKADFRKAFEMDPNYVFAGISLFDILIDNDDLDEADQVLAQLEEHSTSQHVRFRALRLHCKRRDAEAARTTFRLLLEHPEPPSFLYGKGAEVMDNAGYRKEADEILSMVVGEANVASSVLRLWVDRSVTQDDWSFMDRLPALIEQNPNSREALYATIDILSQPKYRKQLHELLHDHGELVRATQRGWAKGTSALVNAGDYQAAITWGADWATREIDETWMLHSLVLAYRRLARYEDAYRVAQSAIALDDDDGFTDEFRVWVAFEDAIAKRMTQAEEGLSLIEVDALDDVPRILYTLTETLLAVQKHGRSEFVKARREGLDAIKQFAPQEGDPDLVLSYRRWVDRLAKDAGGLAAWMWAKLGGRKLPQ